MTASARRSFYLEGHGHGNLPVPAASRVGSMIATSGVRGVDRSTGELCDDAQRQIEHMFHNLAAIVAAAGGSQDTILKVTIFVRAADIRPLINSAWLRHFPDPSNRPARHVVESPSLAGGMVVQCEALAVTVAEGTAS